MQVMDRIRERFTRSDRRAEAAMQHAEFQLTELDRIAEETASGAA
jgi:hypothetical protein